jgi:carboxymethylenebutenolidase
MNKPLFIAIFMMSFWLAGAAYADSGMADSDYVARMAHLHAGETPAATPAATARPAVPVAGSAVQYATVDGNAVTGYLARPAHANGPLPGIIVIHEWWGLNDNIRAMADRLAGEGYQALAVDLYGGQAATTADEAQTLMRHALAHIPAVEANLRQAYAYLADTAHAPRIGVIGWCFGGGWSLQTALMFPHDIDAAVMYYGRPVTDRDALATLDMPLLGLFGAEDDGITPQVVHRFEADLKAAGVDADIHIYPGAPHAFANPSGSAYRPEAARDAWRRTIEFFAANLKDDR